MKKSEKFGYLENSCNYPFLTMMFCHRIIHPKDADGMASSVDPDQTTPLGAV